MKKHFFSMVAVCMVVLFGAGMGFAGQGKGPGDGTGPIHDVLSGIPFAIEGDVVGIAQDGSLTLSTIDGDVQLYGIGPAYYWESEAVAYPEIGETLTASGFIVDYNGIDRYVVITVTIEGTSIELRDPETGKPLWRGTNGVSAGSGSGNTGSDNPGNTGGTGGNAGSGSAGGSASSGGTKGGACK